MTKSKITIINTGGTFNKVYNTISGVLEVSKNSKALEEILRYCYNVDFEVITIISKDSLDMNEDDRELIVQTIDKIQNEKIIIVHGTDTMDLSSSFVDKFIKNKIIVFLGAMLPISINKVEATLNFAMALGFLNANVEKGVYISMHGSVKGYKDIKKDRKLGQFLGI